MSENNSNTECVRRYHQRTKHRIEKYANGPETLDWSMQPNAFRRFEGSTIIDLPFCQSDLTISYNDIYRLNEITDYIPVNTPEKKILAPFNLSSIAALFEFSMGLSGWKEYQGERWALRCNPSSGNLHPTEAYVVCTGIEDLAPGVYHYMSYDHTLERRCCYQDNHNSNNVTTNQSYLVIGLSSIFWREAWKYGERAFRYCQLDTGHALAALRYACAMLGWQATIVTQASDADIELLLGLDRDEDFGDAEQEDPDLLLLISKYPDTAEKTESPFPVNSIINTLLQHSQNGTWEGSANILDQNHLYNWPIIDEVAQSCRSPGLNHNSPCIPEELPPLLPCNSQLQAREIIQRRRSAQHFDGQTSIEASDFFRILDTLMPRAIPPWDTLPWQARIHIVLFVHRVDGLESGLYILFRNHNVALESVKSAFSDKMQWQQVEQAPQHLPFYRLVKANAQNAAATLSCHQRIASDSAFSLGMLCEFDMALEAGPWNYRHLFWEAGVIGQVLYLEAEAIDLQGTGIGCFFDDSFHEMLGISDTQYQSLYHFTVGGALNDRRLRTIMPYAHITRG